MDSTGPAPSSIRKHATRRKRRRTTRAPSLYWRASRIERWCLIAAGVVSLLFLFSAVRHFTSQNLAIAIKPASAVKLAAKPFEASSASLAQRTIGEAFRDCPECPELMVVPAGKYAMGSPASEFGRSDDEGPVHTIVLPRPIAVGKYEVTFEQWDACASAGDCSHRPDDRSWGRENRPVINVNWADAKAYAKWLAAKTGKPYRLLTESEWEYAARAGSSTRYPWGDDAGKDQAVLRDATSISNFYQTAPVGTFSANRFGLHDMIGNAWEWTEDCWNESFAGAPTDGSAWLSGDCGQRVVRGASWLSAPRDARTAVRFGYVASARMSDVGFRVVRTD